MTLPLPLPPLPLAALARRRTTGWCLSTPSRSGAQYRLSTSSHIPAPLTTPNAPRSPARVRFAPSPTGYLHLGGLRTALFNYLVAKRSGGQFLLRIEDTDQARTVPGAADHLVRMLKWSGLTFDEGPGVEGPVGPYVQSHRSQHYKEAANQLLKDDKAYRCFCTPERLENVRTLAKRSGRIVGYDQHCRHHAEDHVQELLAANTPHTIRFKVPSTGTTTFQDIVHSQCSFGNKTLDDTILLKSDGLPTYHLANVVDDHMMGITHVLRGEEWVSSTPKHILLYQAFGWEPPRFAHLPLLINKDGSKLSKRQGDVHIAALIDKGYLPEALLNFVAFLGWGPGTTKELYTLSELAHDFDLTGVNKSPAVVDYGKLNHLNKLHIARRLADPVQTDHLVRQILPALREAVGKGDTAGRVEDLAYVTRVVVAVKDRIRLLTEVPRFARPFFVEPDLTTPDAVAWRDTFDLDEVDRVVNATLDGFVKSDEGEWATEVVKGVLNGVAGDMKLEFVKVMKDLRYVVTGTKVGVDMITILHVLGRERTLERLKAYRRGSQL